MNRPVIFMDGIDNAIANLYHSLYTTAKIDDCDYLKIKSMFEELVEFRNAVKYKYLI